MPTERKIIDLTGEIPEIARKSFGEILTEQHPELAEQANRASQSLGSQLKDILPDGEDIPPLELPMYNPLEVRR